MNAFLPADILIPKTDSMEKWAVIACDQFTSDKAYWERVRRNAEGAVSTINLILPEAELGTEQEAAHTAEINRTMADYMNRDVFTIYPNSYVYVERTLENGAIRKGLIGMVDLDAYDYTTGATSAIRATERTVPERIPPRQRVRRDAPIELPHILMLCDDHKKVLIEPIGAKKDSLKKLYDFDLMEASARVSGSFAQKLTELSLIYESYLSVCRNGRNDPVTRLLRLGEMLEQEPYAEGKTFYLDGFSDFTAAELRVLGTLMRSAEAVTVTLLSDGSRNTVFRTAEDTRLQLKTMAARMNVPVQMETVEKDSARPADTSFWLQRVFSSSAEIWPEEAPHIYLHRAETIEDECRFAASFVRQLTREGLRCREIAVAAADPETYLPLLRPIFTRAGIPSYYAGNTDILKKPLFSAILSAMIDQLGYGRDDRRLASVVLPAYDQILCRVDPGAWMKKCREVCCPAADTAAEQTIWGAFLMKTLRRTLLAAEENLTDALERMERDETLCGKYQKLFQDNLQSVRDLLQKTSWDDVCRSLIVSFGTLPPVRKECDADLQEKLKNIRKTALQDIRSVQAYFYADSAQVIADLRATSGPVFGLLDFVDAFDKAYQREKRRKKIFDFSDLEHQAIRLLTDCGTGRPTAAAQEIAQKYREILVDEYQDSNAVQEWIFQSVSHGGENLFLVGDVKQSIYRFRLAEPEIFLEKYARYAPQEKAVPGQPRKILLSENFRSRPEILEAVNDVFRLVMSPEAGDLAYGEEEALKPGRAFPPVPQSRVELHCIDLDVQTGDDEASPEKSRYEAAFVAQRIDRLLRDKTPVTDGETTRPARPGDIVILMRSPGRTASFYTEALAHYHIPSISDRGGSILETTEVQVLSAILAILDNPHQDIPLITAMLSPPPCLNGNCVADRRYGLSLPG